ncbi:hypothetical protein YQE_02744, partial [Dendroctonus ponderosae]
MLTILSSEFIMSAETELSMQSGLQSVLLPPDLTTLSLIGHRPPAQGPHLGHLPPAHPMSQTNGLCIAWKLPGACFLVVIFQLLAFLEHLVSIFHLPVLCFCSFP